MEGGQVAVPRRRGATPAEAVQKAAVSLGHWTNLDTVCRKYGQSVLNKKGKCQQFKKIFFLEGFLLAATEIYSYQLGVSSNVGEDGYGLLNGGRPAQKDELGIISC